MSSIFRKLKKLRGDFKQNNQLSFIETLTGNYEDQNVLEGFRANTELLCSDLQNDKSEPFSAEKRLVAEAFESFSFSSSGLRPSSTKYIIS